MKKKALLLGAGGPLGGLEAGALIALDEMGVHFDIISGACIGSVLTLAYTSPAKGMTGREALEMWCNASGLSDIIYHSFCQSNFKVFQKNAGPLNIFTDTWLEFMTRMNPYFTLDPRTETQRFCNDMYLYGLTAMTPGMLMPQQPSISRIAPFLDSFIDFENVKNVAKDIYINALNVTDKQIEIFNKKQITMQHVIAGSSLFFLCPQQCLDGKWYGEGSYVDSLNYQGLINEQKDIDTIVVMNILNKEALIRTPESLYDAYNLSIMLPFITIAEDDTKIFEAKYKGDRNLLKVGFRIPEEHAPYVMDWSASNFKVLRDIGYHAGMDFFEKNKALLE
ncbi:MAG: patatin-like phospholipase family protein [Proteobacteria bacterium]|nr:patatin-like phospholipase family protein [Pseudomonadota bacterium]